MTSSAGGDWRPTATVDRLKARARILFRIRAFFDRRDVLEVETPCLSAAGTTDPHIDSFRTRYTGPGAAAGRNLWLHTSPEFAMKRLLAAGSGPIWQLARVFRDGEAGRRHNPEFSLLEWYRPGFDLPALMAEVAELIREVLDANLPVRQLSYADAFAAALGVDPHQASVAELKSAAAARDLGPVAGLGEERDDWLNLLVTHCVEPAFPPDELVFLYGYPASQAALARLAGDPPTAERFECYLGGMELANGFHELTDADEQGRRFAAERGKRRAADLPDVPADEHLLAALASGLPDCSGVALGVDRLVMLAVGADHIDEVIAFPTARA